jgi:hypothetical protein
LFPGFQSRAGYPQNGPAAGGGYVLRARPKVKVRRNRGQTIGSKAPEIGSVKIKDLAASRGPNQRYIQVSALSLAALVIADGFPLR